MRRGLPARVIIFTLMVTALAGIMHGSVARPAADIRASLPDLTLSEGSNITVPVTVSDLTGLGVIAYDIQITFDPQVLTPAAQSVSTAGTLSSEMSVSPNATHSGHLIIPAFQAGLPLTGSGTLLNLNFTVIGTSGSSTALAFADYVDANNILHPGFVFNEGNPSCSGQDGRVEVFGIAVSGTIGYGNAIGTPTQRFVSNVTLTGLGSPIVTTTTRAPGTTAGRYWLSGFGEGPYVVTPTKTGGTNGAINSFDAATISRHVANIPPLLTGNQLTVADVSGNGVVTSFDAAQLSAFVVHAPIGGSTGIWRFIPGNRAYPYVESDFAGEDYSALLMGEVSGNWTNTGGSLRTVGSRSERSGGPERRIEVSLPKLMARSDSEIRIPVALTGAAAKGVIAYEFDLRYDPNVIQPQADPIDLIGTVSQGLTAAVNAREPGILRVAVYGPMPIVSDGILFDLKFAPVGKPGEGSPLGWERIMFNDGSTPISAADGEIALF